MNKISVVVIVVMVVFGTVLGCKKGAGASGKGAALKNQLDEAGFRLPDGTIFTENTDAEGELTSIAFQLPEDCKIYGTTATGELLTDDGGKLTCTCDGNGNCKPFAVSGKMGCLVDGCTKCTGTTASRLSGKPLTFFLIRNGELDGMDALAMLGNTRPIYSFEEWRDAWFPTRDEMASMVFQEAMRAILSYIEPYGTKDMVAVAYMINGKKMLINVPFSSLDDGTMYTKAITEGSYACTGNCNGGSTKCNLEEAAMGSVFYCDGCQSGCTISMTR